MLKSPRKKARAVWKIATREVRPEKKNHIRGFIGKMPEGKVEVEKILKIKQLPKGQARKRAREGKVSPKRGEEKKETFSAALGKEKKGCRGEHRNQLCGPRKKGIGSGDRRALLA